MIEKYRRTVELDRDAEYHYVELGPIPGKPGWHEQAKPSSYAFPSVEAATRFAQGHKEPGRSVLIRFPDGRGWNGKAWVA